MTLSTVRRCQCERGRCEVRASIPRNLTIFNNEREAIAPQKFSSNFHRNMQPTTRKMWVSASRIPYPARFRSRRRFVSDLSAICVGCESGMRRLEMVGTCCSKNTVRDAENTACLGFHSKVTNTVLYLANTDAAFVVFESRLMAASYGSGEVEASLAGKAPQSWFGAFSLSASAWAYPTSPVGRSLERSALCRRARKFSSCRDTRSGFASARRRGQSVATRGCRKV
jgi:hypothetical protein